MLGLVHRHVTACGAVHGVRAMIDTMMQRWRKLGVAGQTSERRGMLESFITTPIRVKSLFRSLKGIADWYDDSSYTARYRQRKKGEDYTMRTIKGTRSIKAFKAVRSLEPLELDEVIYQTAVQAINAGDTWEHGEAVRTFIESGRVCIEWHDGTVMHYTGAGAWY